ncbi:MAG: 50S ribosomal protein L22 [Candidatus Andersenbacteria bacterium]|nr:50S ribosomal protein L22 [Candidatus Andersenbacteria bacterium]
MHVSAHLKNARMSPRKLRLWRQAVIGLPVREARAQLQWQPSKGAGIILGVLNSAVANATHNLEMAEDNLRLADLTINAGLTFKRFRPVSKGMAHAYVKRTSHLTVVLVEITPQAHARTRKAADIATVTVEALAADVQPQQIDAGRARKNVPAPPGGRSATEEAYQKVKMMQQGGDKKKTHRRKSV